MPDIISLFVGNEITYKENFIVLMRPTISEFTEMNIT